VVGLAMTASFKIGCEKTKAAKPPPFEPLPVTPPGDSVKGAAA
jgi:hypothetical protein